MTDISHSRKSREVLRIFGPLLTIAGLMISTSVLAFARSWDYISMPGGFEVPMIVPGLALIVLGCALAWAGRRVRAAQIVEKIDVTPIAEWVRAFERHQAELEFHRLSDLNHGMSLVKYEPRVLTSRHEPAA
jgi:hypothetical protein